MSNERDETRTSIELSRKAETPEVSKAINLLRNAAADWGIHRARRDAAAAQREHFKVLEAEKTLREAIGASRERERQLREVLEAYADRENWYEDYAEGDSWYGAGRGWEPAERVLEGAPPTSDAKEG